MLRTPLELIEPFPKVDMKCMVSYIQWYHEMNNGEWMIENTDKTDHLDIPGSVRLLRTGATAGTPYSYMINKVNRFYPCYPTHVPTIPTYEGPNNSFFLPH